jgi:predicted RNase H-like nuclease
MAVVFGLDGFRNGWVAVQIAGRRREILFFRHVAELLARPFDRAAIDIPIGLPETGDRRCDLDARVLLRPHASRVFTGARRAVWEHRSQTEANRVLKARGEPMVSAQLWNLGDKIMQVDAVMSPRLQRCVVEAHPELVFLRLNGMQPLPRKKDRDGIALRRALLLKQGFRELDDWLNVRRIGRGAKTDDVLDACAMAIAARDGAHCLPAARAPKDARGLKMQIWY